MVVRVRVRARAKTESHVMKGAVQTTPLFTAFSLAASLAGLLCQDIKADKQGQTNKQGKQHSTPKAVTFPRKK